ncbi:MAG TPA: serpin family protein [Verrucomicrobiae bacterium]|nr:serpin family protein [Verrucomicrobiae bacterium]
MKTSVYLMMFLGSLTSAGVLVFASPNETNLAATANNDLAFSLYSQISRKPGNLVLSPISIATTLAMIHSGACGSTARELRTALHLPDGLTNSDDWLAPFLRQVPTTTKQQVLFVANSVWVQQGWPLRTQFSAIVQRDYDALMQPINFDDPDASAQIDSWVSKATRGKILHLAGGSGIRSDMRLIVANAIYFKGAWLDGFDPHRTAEVPFHSGAHESRPIPTMRKRGVFLYATNETIQAIQLPYEDTLSMLILLPVHEASFREVEKSLTNKELRRILGSMKSQEVEVWLPRFACSSEESLREVLRSFGVRDVFSPTRADLCGISDKSGLYLRTVLHSAFLTVDEWGSEAASATTGFLALGEVPPLFKADHPFVFFILDNVSHAIIFMGRISDPSSAKEP